MRPIAVFATALLAVVAATVARSAEPGERVAGRPIAEVLREANDAGLRIVFSEALVPEQLLVLQPPQATEPAARLREILAPHGLTLEALGESSYVVVRAAPSWSPQVAGPPDEVQVVSSRYRLETLRSDEPLRVGAVDLERQPALLDDPTRGIRRFPGTAGTAYSSRTFVRGGLSDENLLLLDGVPLQEPFHLPGLPADVSFLDPVILERVDFYSGVLPVEYGGRMSAVIDMRTRAPAAQLEGRAALSTMHASALVAGPIREHGDWLVFGRRSLLDQVAKVVDPGFGKPVLLDAFARVRHRIGNSGTLMLGTLIAHDDLDLASRGGAERSSGISDRGYVWGAWDSAWRGATSRTVLSHASGKLDRTGQVIDAAETIGRVTDERRISTTFLRQDWELPITGGSWRWGLAARRDETRYAYARDIVTLPEVAALFGQAAASQFALAADVKLREYEAWTALSKELSHWTLDGGVHWTHADYSTGKDHAEWDPRLAVLYRASSATHVRLAWGRMTQTWAASELPVEIDGALMPDSSRTRTLTLGVEHELGAAVALRIEAYDKDVQRPRPRRENILDPLTLVQELRPDTQVIRPSSARIRGAEIHLSGPFRDGIEGWASYAWSQARDVVDGGDIARSWDQLHAVAAGAAMDKGSWKLSGAITVRSGWPTTPILPGPPPLGIEIGERNSAQGDDFFTLDLRAERRFALAHGDLRLVLEVQNATNRANYCCSELRFERDAEGGLVAREVRRDWLPLVPQASIAWTF